MRRYFQSLVARARGSVSDAPMVPAGPPAMMSPAAELEDPFERIGPPLRQEPDREKVRPPAPPTAIVAPPALVDRKPATPAVRAGKVLRGAPERTATPETPVAPPSKQAQRNRRNPQRREPEVPEEVAAPVVRLPERVIKKRERSAPAVRPEVLQPPRSIEAAAAAQLVRLEAQKLARREEGEPALRAPEAARVAIDQPAPPRPRPEPERSVVTPLNPPKRSRETPRRTRPEKPRLVIGQIKVEVAAPSKAPREVVRVVKTVTSRNQPSTTAPHAARLRYGLGQM